MTPNDAVLTVDRLMEIDALWLKATDTPWNAAPYKEGAEAVTVALIGDWRVEHTTPGIKGGNYRDTRWGNDVDDANLIAALVNAWPQLRDLALRRDVPGWKLVPIDALKLIAALPLSHEPMMSDCLYRSPAESMRRAADEMERKDAAIMAARNALAAAPASGEK